MKRRKTTEWQCCGRVFLDSWQYRGHRASHFRYYPPLAERFAEKVDDSQGPDACWPWTGARDSKGYGTIHDDGRCLRAPRVALARSLGRPLEAGEFACHHCDNPPCVNPRHLFVGDARANAHDAIAKGRATLPPVRRGERHPRARLTPELVLAARRRAAHGEAVRGLAREYGVHPATLDKAVRGVSWSHLAMPRGIAS